MNSSEISEGMPLAEAPPGYVYPGWLFSLDVVQGAKERALSGYPTFYLMRDVIAAGDFQNYTIRVDENELWFVDSINAGDILPDLFHVTISVDEQEVMERQLLRMSLMDIVFPSPFPSVGRVDLVVENNTTASATYEAIVWYRKFSRPTVNRALEFLGLERI